MSDILASTQGSGAITFKSFLELVQTAPIRFAQLMGKSFFELRQRGGASKSNSHWFIGFIEGLCGRVAHKQPGACDFICELSRRFQRKLRNRPDAGKPLSDLVLKSASRDAFDASSYQEQPAKERVHDGDGLEGVCLTLIWFMVLVRRAVFNPTPSEKLCYGYQTLGLASFPALGQGTDTLEKRLESWWIAGDEIIRENFGAWHMLPIEAALAPQRGAADEQAGPLQMTQQRKDFRDRAKERFQSILRDVWKDEVLGSLIRENGRTSGAGALSSLAWTVTLTGHILKKFVQRPGPSTDSPPSRV